MCKKINLALKNPYVIDKYWPNFNFVLAIDQYPDIQGMFSAALHEFNCYILGAEC